MSVSIAVMAHPDRRTIAEALRSSLAGSEIVWDPEPHSTLRSPWRTNRAALEATPAGASHRLVVQEDVLVVPSLVETVERIASRHRERLVTLFVAGRPAPSAHAVLGACSRGECYATIPTTPWVPTVALLWPVDLISRVLAFVDEQRWPESFTADDAIVGRAMTALREPLYATVPSLVEHPDQEPSMMGARRNYAGLDPGRVAACFLDEGIDPLTFDW